VDGEFNVGVAINLSYSFYIFSWGMVQFKLQAQSLDLWKILCIHDVNI
jgi:hypothetical protein